MTYFVDRGCENNHLNVASCDVRKNKYILKKLKQVYIRSASMDILRSFNSLTKVQ